MRGVDGNCPAGKALPVASDWPSVGESGQTQCVREEATQVTFRLELERGPARIKTWWYDVEGNRLAGAYYLTAERI